MKKRIRFNQYTGPRTDPLQEAWNREAYAKAARLSARPDALKIPRGSR